MRDKLLVIGGGAIGTLFAADAARGLVPTTLLVRNRSRFPAFGLRLVGEFDTGESVRLVEGPDVANEEFECTILACKHFDLAKCGELLKSLQIRTKTCVTLSNGLGCVEQVKLGGFHCEEILPAVTYSGAKKIDTGLVQRTGYGETFVQQPLRQTSADLLHKAIPNVKLVPQNQLDEMIWKKLLANCCINPLTAILNVNNGEIPRIAKPLVTSLANEFMSVCPVPLDLKGLTPVEFVTHVCSTTATNTSSMLTDVLAGRRTEIEALNGALLKLYGEGDMSKLPTHRTIYELVKAIEMKKSKLRAKG